MDSDKAREFVDDVSGDGASSCCGAATYELGESNICKECGEYCEVAQEEE